MVFSLAFGIILLTEGQLVKGIAAAVVFAAALAVMVIVWVFDSNLTRYVTRMDKDIVAVSRETFYDYPEPIVIADGDEKVVWYNKSFEDHLFSDDRAYGISLSELVGNNTAKKIGRAHV